jgi:hypothetical protein
VRLTWTRPAPPQTRKSVFDMIAADRLAFVGYHMPFPSVGYIEKAGRLPLHSGNLSAGSLRDLPFPVSSKGPGSNARVFVCRKCGKCALQRISVVNSIPLFQVPEEAWYLPLPTHDTETAPGHPLRAAPNRRNRQAMATIIQSITGAEALTFDDVLLQPGHSESHAWSGQYCDPHRPRF